MILFKRQLAPTQGHETSPPGITWLILINPSSFQSRHSFCPFGSSLESVTHEKNQTPLPPRVQKWLATRILRSNIWSWKRMTGSDYSTCWIVVGSCFGELNHVFFHKAWRSPNKGTLVLCFAPVSSRSVPKSMIPPSTMFHLGHNHMKSMNTMSILCQANFHQFSSDFGVMVFHAQKWSFTPKNVLSRFVHGHSRFFHATQFSCFVLFSI